MTDYPFSLSGPHSPGETRRVADLLAECVRHLNHATMPAQEGLQYPQDVYTLLGHLTTAMQRMPQLMRQLAAFMEAQSATGRLADHNHQDAALWARVVAHDLGEIADRFHSTAYLLERRQNGLSAMYVPGPIEGE
jgi:hypothetical protein